MTTPMHHGRDKYAVGQGQLPIFEGVNALVLYTLSPDATSEFMDVKLCKVRCIENKTMKHATMLSTSAKIIVLGMLIYTITMEDEDSPQRNKIK